jgi:outer membrane protein assembly factor BamB
MKVITGLFAVVIAIAIAAPAAAQPFHIENKGVTYAANSSGTGPARVSALVTSTGAQIWTTHFGGIPNIPSDFTATALALDKDVLYVSGYSPSIAPQLGFLISLNAATGQILWTTRLTGGGIFSAATVDKDVLYVVSWSPQVFGSSKTSAVNALTGEILWFTNTPYPAFSSPSLDKGTVVVVTGGVSDFPTFLVLFDAATGQQIRAVQVP